MIKVCFHCFFNFNVLVPFYIHKSFFYILAVLEISAIIFGDDSGVISIFGLFLDV